MSRFNKIQPRRELTSFDSILKAFQADYWWDLKLKDNESMLFHTDDSARLFKLTDKLISFSFSDPYMSVDLLRKLLEFSVSDNLGGPNAWQASFSLKQEISRKYIYGDECITQTQVEEYRAEIELIFNNMRAHQFEKLVKEFNDTSKSEKVLTNNLSEDQIERLHRQIAETAFFMKPPLPSNAFIALTQPSQPFGSFTYDFIDSL